MYIYIYMFHGSGFAGHSFLPVGYFKTRIFMNSKLMLAMSGWQRLDVTSC